MVDAKKTIYLHIGQPKTGSTAIQEGLAKHTKQLEKHGYAYPFAGEIAHHNLAYELLPWELHFDPALCTFTKLQTYLEQTPNQNIILSSEDFSHATIQDLQKLATLLHGYQVKIVVYLRRQDQLVQSTWAQYTKIGLPMLDFDKWIDNYLHVASGKSTRANEDLSSISKRLNYEAFIANYVCVFGEDNILIRAYEREYMSDAILADFLQLIGMDDTHWVPQNQTRNVSPSMKSLEFFRQIAIAWRNSGQDKAFQTHAKYRHYFGRLNELTDTLGWNNERLNLIDRTRYDQVMQIYDEGNQSVAQTYLGRDKLFREPFVDRPLTTHDISDFDTSELLVMMQALTTQSLQMTKRYHAPRTAVDQIFDVIYANPILKKLLRLIMRR